MSRKPRLGPQHRKIVDAVCHSFDSERSALLDTTRGSPKDAIARQALMWVLYHNYLEDYTSIGQMIGRYRKTVSHGVAQTELRMSADRSFSDKVYKTINAL